MLKSLAEIVDIGYTLITDLEKVMSQSGNSLVTLNGTQVSVNCRNPDEASLALRELKLLKKEVGIQKRQINEEQRKIRTQYTEEVRTRGSMVRGGGTIGRMIRTVQTISRDSRRSSLAQELAPYEEKKQKIEMILLSIDKTILQIERYLA